MVQDAIQAYQEAAVFSADPMSLVRMLYEAAVDAVRQARNELARKDAMARSRRVSRALNILCELTISLDRESGGEIAKNLAELYAYMQQRLLTAHAEQSDAKLAEVEKLLVTLLEGWRGAARSEASRRLEPAEDAQAAAQPLPQPAFDYFGGRHQPIVTRNWSL